MKKVLLILFTVSLSSYSQILKIEEIGSSKESKAITHGIVDINADLNIKLSKEELAVKIGNSKSGNKELAKQIENLNNVLKTEAEILDLLAIKSINLDQDEKLDILKEFSDLWDSLNNGLIDMGLEDEVTKYYQIYHNDITDFTKKKYGHPYQFILESLNKKLSSDINKLVDEIDEKTYQLQMVAYLDSKEKQNTKVHIDNFDEYKDGEFYEVPRWVSSFSQDDIAAFERSKKLADNLNAALNQNLAYFKDLIVANFKSIECLKTSISELQNLYNKRNTLFTGYEDIAKIHLKAIEEDYKSLLNITENINQFNEGTLNIEALQLFNQLSEVFIKNTSTFVEKIDFQLNTFIKDIGGATTEINDLKALLTSCHTNIKKDEDLIIDIFNFTKNFFSPIKRTADFGEEIGDEVYSFGLRDLPENGFIELKKTGRRDSGDKLRVLLIIKTKDELRNKERGTTIEKEILTLEQLKFYSVSNIGVILANPFNESCKVVLENQFQFAPSGSLLFKFGSRTSRTWNTISPGFGFNISTPDFDLDGTPEIGVGVVTTLLKDIVSVGLSYNTRTDNPYWFFGLSLPFSTLGLPINTIKTNGN